jgi:hypothetical protein
VIARLVVTTIVRDAPLGTPGGHLRVVDLAGGKQEAMPLPDAVHRARDTNPRGGLRGGRGLAVAGERLAVALNDRILVLDRGWQVRNVLTHSWVGGLHDIAADDDGIWATCVDNDLLLRFGWDGSLIDHWQWTTDRRLRRALGQRWLPGFDRWTDYRDPLGGGFRIDVGHLNAIAADEDGLLLGLGLIRAPTPVWWPVLRERGLRLANRIGAGRLADAALRSWRASRPPNPRPAAPAPDGWTWALLSLAADRRARVVARHPAQGRPVHNIVPHDELLAVCDSPGGRIVGVERSSGAIVRSVALGGEFPFPRGLLALADGRLVAGVQAPAALAIVDLDAERVDERILLADDHGESPYAIAELPDGFAALQRFEG